MVEAAAPARKVARPYQARALAEAKAAYRSGKRAILLVCPTGGGKCLGEGTPVLMFDGSIVAVEAVASGDLLMGPDGLPRIVRSTARGSGPLFRIVPTKGEPWVCNDVHVLTLVRTQTGAVVDIDLPNYFAASKTFRHEHKLFAPAGGVDFAAPRDLPVDPYFVGLWYGDGTKGLSANGDHLHGVAVDEDRCPTRHLVGRERTPEGYGRNRLLETMREVYGDGTTLPRAYLTASREDRRSFLAGLLDSDGYLHHGGFEIVQKRRGWSDGICFLARSLGFRALMVEKIVNGESYWRVHISGDASGLPMRIPRKMATARLQKKTVTRTGFAVEPAGNGDYFGFELDSDGRFLLGDFTVTHNTFVGSQICQGAIDKGGTVLWLAHREELLKQAQKAIMAEGLLDVGIIAPWARRQHARIQVASVQTLAAQIKKGRDLPKASVVVLDEAHHFAKSAAGWFEVAKHYCESAMLGLTATPERGDGSPLGDLFDCLIPVSSVQELQALGVLVPCVTYRPDHKTKALSREPHQAYLEHGAGERAFVFCATVPHAEQVAESFRLAGVPAATIHADTPWSLRGARLEAFAKQDAGPLRRAGSPEDAPLVLCNVYCLTEGVDVPSASVCILARGCGHPGMMLQMAGRVLRAAPGKERAILWDLRGVTHKLQLPEKVREYSLEGKAITAKSEKDDPPRKCVPCGAIFMTWATTSSGGRVCPSCRASAPEMAAPEVVEREVFAVGSGAAESAKRDALDRLAIRAVDKERAPGWVFHSFREMFQTDLNWKDINAAMLRARALLGVRVDPGEVADERARLEAIARERKIPLSWVAKKLAEKFGEAAA